MGRTSRITIGIERSVRPPACPERAQRVEGLTTPCPLRTTLRPVLSERSESKGSTLALAGIRAGKVVGMLGCRHARSVRPPACPERAQRVEGPALWTTPSGVVSVHDGFSRRATVARDRPVFTGHLRVLRIQRCSEPRASFGGRDDIIAFFGLWCSGYDGSWLTTIGTLSVLNPITRRGVAVRWGVVGVLTCGLLLLIDAVVFVAATTDGWQWIPSTTDRRDLVWWRNRIGEVPPVTGTFYSVPGIGGRDGTWYHRAGRGGDGGSAWAGGPPPTVPPAAQSSLTAARIRASDPYDRLPVLRGRGVAGSDGRFGVRVGVPLPFVMREHWFVGEAGDSLPNPNHVLWSVRFRPIAFIANLVLVSALLGLPFLIFDARTLARHRRGRCLACGYPLHSRSGKECPECGRSAARRGAARTSPLAAS